MTAELPYNKSELNLTIDCIKKKLLNQYKKDDKITVGKALEKILVQRDVKKKSSALIKDSIEILRLYEIEDKKLRDYIKGYMARNKFNSW